MADMTKIVGAVIAIAVRDSVRDVQIGDRDCDRNHPRSYYRGVHRIRWSSRRVLRTSRSGHRHGHCWSPDGRCKAHQLQVLTKMAKGKVVESRLC